MKRILTILFALVTLPVAAQHMLIEKNAGGNQVIDLADLKQITFDGIKVNIEQTDGTASNNAMSDINQICFGDYTAIGSTNENSRELVTYITADEIAVNCKAGSTVTVYSLVGTQMLNVRTTTDNAQISIAGLPKGIYIIKAEERTAKITRR
jgi:hypothetical protein